jgi:hypothetical protein
MPAAPGSLFAFPHALPPERHRETLPGRENEKRGSFAALDQRLMRDRLRKVKAQLRAGPGARTHRTWNMPEQQETGKIMVHIQREHQIDIAIPIEEALALFTPIGEMRWIADWRPVFLHPADGKTEEGMVFTTGEGEDFTIWSCIEWSPERHRVRYARVTPASRLAHVTVECAPLARRQTRVSVRYDLTALNAAGQATLESLSETAFRTSIDSWKSMIEAKSA